MNTSFNATSTFGSNNLYGIEIEAYYPRSWNIEVGRYHHPIQVPELPEGWGAESDSSIERGPIPDYRGIEIKSPKLKGQEGLEQIKQVLQVLKEKGGIVDKRCGLHVSINLPLNRQGWKDLRKIASVASFLEEGLYAISGNPYRKGNHYCKSIRDEVLTKGRIYREMRRDRYFHLNLTNIEKGQGRVEFRAFGGTLELLNIISYINIAMAIVERALNAKVTPSLRPDDITKGGNFVAGNKELTEANRLISYISWRKGDAKAHGKQDEPFGIVGTLFTAKEMIKHIKNLANKMHEMVNAE